MGNLFSTSVDKELLLPYDKFIQQKMTKCNLKDWKIGDITFDKTFTPQKKSCKNMMQINDIIALISPLNIKQETNFTEFIESLDIDNYKNMNTSDPRIKILKPYVLEVLKAIKELQKTKQYLSTNFLELTILAYKNIDSIKLKKALFYMYPPERIIETPICEFFDLSDQNIRKKYVNAGFGFTKEEKTIYRSSTEKILEEQEKEQTPEEEEEGEQTPEEKEGEQPPEEEGEEQIPEEEGEEQIPEEEREIPEQEGEQPPEEQEGEQTPDDEEEEQPPEEQEGEQPPDEEEEEQPPEEQEGEQPPDEEEEEQTPEEEKGEQNPEEELKQNLEVEIPDTDSDDFEIVDAFPEHPEFQEMKRMIIKAITTRRNILNVVDKYESEQIEVNLDADEIQSIHEKMMSNKTCDGKHINKIKCKIVKALWTYKYIHDNMSLLTMIDEPNLDVEYCNSDLDENVKSITEFMNSQRSDLRIKILEPHILQAIYDYHEFMKMKKELLFAAQKILPQIEDYMTTFCKEEKSFDNTELYQEIAEEWKNEKSNNKNNYGDRWRLTDDEATIPPERIIYDNILEELKEALQDEEYQFSSENDQMFFLLPKRIRPFKNARPGDIITIEEQNFQLLSPKPILELFIMRKQKEYPELDIEELKVFMKYEKCMKTFSERIGKIKEFDQFTFNFEHMKTLGKIIIRLDKLFNDDNFAKFKDMVFSELTYEMYIDFKNNVKCLGTYLKSQKITPCTFTQQNEEIQEETKEEIQEETQETQKETQETQEEEENYEENE